jgi:hypothetical protein
MVAEADLIVFGTGNFAARILFDIAATATAPVTAVVAGRNPERLDWLRLAADARAVIFSRPAKFVARRVDLHDEGAAEAVLAEFRPRLVVQAASTQTSSVISAQVDAWSRLVAEGGLSATAVFNALFSVRVARALRAGRPDAYYINCSFADVVNPLIAACGLPVTCGIGNVAILSSVFAAALDRRTPGAVKVLAHYQTITPFRRAAETRKGPVPRVWLEDGEVADVNATFRGVKLTPEPVIDVSGASGVPLMLAMVSGGDWVGHTPGPNGLPGGYPVALRRGALDLDLPSGLGRDAAIRWNARFEEENGLVIGADGTARYTGVLYERLRASSPELAAGFHVRDLEEVHKAMEELRARLSAQPAR